MDPQPTTQGRSNAYALRDHIREHVPSQRRLEVEYLIAPPNTSRAIGDQPPGGDWVNVVCGETLDDPDALTDRTG